MPKGSPHLADTLRSVPVMYSWDWRTLCITWPVHTAASRSARDGTVPTRISHSNLWLKAKTSLRENRPHACCRHTHLLPKWQENEAKLQRPLETSMRKIWMHVSDGFISNHLLLSSLKVKNIFTKIHLNKMLQWNKSVVLTVKGATQPYCRNTVSSAGLRRPFTLAGSADLTLHKLP